MSLQRRRCKSLVILIIINVFISSRTNVFILPWATNNLHRWRIKIVRIYNRIFLRFLTKKKKWCKLPIKNYHWSVFVYTDTYIYYNLLYNIILSIIYCMNILNILPYYSSNIFENIVHTECRILCLIFSLETVIILQWNILSHSYT